MCSARTFKIASEQYRDPQQQPKRQPKHRLDINTILPLPPVPSVATVTVAHLFVCGQQLARA